MRLVGWKLVYLLRVGSHCGMGTELPSRHFDGISYLFSPLLEGRHYIIYLFSQPVYRTFSQGNTERTYSPDVRDRKTNSVDPDARIPIN